MLPPGSRRGVEHPKPTLLQFFSNAVSFRPFFCLSSFLAPLNQVSFLHCQWLEFHIENSHKGVQLLQNIQNLLALSFIEVPPIKDGISLPHESKECSQGERHIQIIGHGIEDALLEGISHFGDDPVFLFVALRMLDAADEFLQAFVTAFGIENILGSDVDGLAVSESP